MLSERRQKRYQGFEKRISLINQLLLVAFVILAGRTWYIQLMHGHQYRQMAEEQRQHPQRLKAPRGRILGKDNVVLADNRPACDIVLVPAECDDPASVCQLLSELIGIDAEQLAANIAKRKRQPFEQIFVKRDVAKSDLFRVEEHSYALPGVFTVVSPQRRYVYGAVAGQVLGYLGEIGPDEITHAKDVYSLGDWVGRAGIERMYESDLHGQDGRALVTRYAKGSPQLRTDVRGKTYISTKDSYGHLLEETHRREPATGNPVSLTLDIGLQAKAEALLGTEVGAIVVLDADTGAVLALASTPGYDPSVFISRGLDPKRRNEERNALLKARDPNPMLCRAFREVYPPGSVFKILMAAAALEEGIIDEKTTFFCPGHYQIDGKGRRWKCWKHSGHGWVDLVDSLAFSCDVFFYSIGRKLGVDTINLHARKVALGVKTGLDMPREEGGLIPSREWFKRYRKKVMPDQPWEWNWRTGDTINMSIGQGAVTTTPLQVAVLMAAVVNGGYRVKPYLNRAHASPPQSLSWSERTIAVIQRGMRKCVEKDDVAPTGTGKAAKIPGVAILGKTGSAQVVRLEEYENEEDIPYERRDHAWFTAGVLDRQPRVAICILVEHGHHGSSAAAPLAKDLIEYLYHDELNPVALAQRGEE